MSNMRPTPSNNVQHVSVDIPARVIKFIETLTVPDGTYVGEKIKLRDFQKNIIREIYGPTDQHGHRIIREAVLSMARKNGKTALVAGLCLAHLCGPVAIRNGQNYSLSFDREQAAIVYNYAIKMVYADAELKNRLTVKESARQIIDPKSGSIFVVLSGEKKGKMGKSASFIMFDELAEFNEDRTLYDALVTATGAHKHPLIISFSTQAKSDNALFSELIDYGESIKNGHIDDKTFKSFLFEAPVGCDIFDEKNWHMANPALGDFRSIEEMRISANKAKLLPSRQSTFKNLYLNQRVSTDDHFVSPEIWRENSGEPDPDVFSKHPVYAGLDLSSKNDLSALVLVAHDGEKTHVMPFFWIPKENLIEKSNADRAPYDIWVDNGYIEATPGPTIDYSFIAAKIAEIYRKYDIAELVFDRWRMNRLKREFDAISLQYHDIKDIVDNTKKIFQYRTGIPLFEFGQGFKDMSQAVEITEDFLLKKNILHGGNPVLTMCVMNTVLEKDAAGSRKFAKNKSTGRIDGIVAMAMAMARMPESGKGKKLFNTAYSNQDLEVLTF